MLSPIFSVDIFKTKFTDTKALAHMRTVADSLSFHKDHPALQDGVLSSWGNRQQTVHLDFEFNPLTEFIERNAKEYWDQLGYYPDVHPRIWQSWVNVTTHNGTVKTHNHCRSPLSAVAYLEANDGAGCIVFENPLDLVIGGQPIKMPYKNFTHRVEVRTGDVLIFPGYLKHYTNPNIDDETRVVFVANLNERGN